MTYVEAISEFQKRSINALKVAQSTQIASLRATRDYAAAFVAPPMALWIACSKSFADTLAIPVRALTPTAPEPPQHAGSMPAPAVPTPATEAVLRPGRSTSLTSRRRSRLPTSRRRSRLPTSRRRSRLPTSRRRSRSPTTSRRRSRLPTARRRSRRSRQSAGVRRNRRRRRSQRSQLRKSSRLQQRRPSRGRRQTIAFAPNARPGK